MKRGFEDHPETVHTGIGGITWENGSSLKVHTEWKMCMSNHLKIHIYTDGTNICAVGITSANACI